MIRHPELFGTVLADVPVEDLVRFHKFTLGRVWLAEYGSPDDPEALPIIIKHSPLHTVSKNPNVTYPAVLVTTADHDTRVIPGHALKFLAEMQSNRPNNINPTLGRIYRNAGHEGKLRKVPSAWQSGFRTLCRDVLICSREQINSAKGRGSRG